MYRKDDHVDFLADLFVADARAIPLGLEHQVEESQPLVGFRFGVQLLLLPALLFFEGAAPIADHLVGEVVQHLDATLVLASQRRSIEDPVAVDPRLYASFHSDLSDAMDAVAVGVELTVSSRLAAHRRLANDVDSGLSDQWEHVDDRTGGQVFFHASHQFPTLIVEDVHEAVEDLEVEGRRQLLAAHFPTLARCQEEAVAQPRLQIAIFTRFRDQFRARQNWLKWMLRRRFRN